jgi:hypothetical protein
LVLGLGWNTEQRTVSIPDEKVAKTRRRVIAILTRGKATKTEFYKVLGSLRHVATCLRTANSFHQRLQTQCTAAPRFGTIKLPQGAKTDLRWFKHILDYGCLAELPLKRLGELPAADVELFMDASDAGLAVLDPPTGSFIQIKFDEEELQLIHEGYSGGNVFLINVREDVCITLALWTWGLTWLEQAGGNMVHVKCWSDNTTAVSWCNRL